jgi:hypothetical protein
MLGGPYNKQEWVEIDKQTWEDGKMNQQSPINMQTFTITNGPLNWQGKDFFFHVSHKSKWFWLKLATFFVDKFYNIFLLIGIIRYLLIKELITWKVIIRNCYQLKI